MLAIASADFGAVAARSFAFMLEIPFPDFLLSY
jgi:hypothetical protein